VIAINRAPWTSTFDVRYAVTFAGGGISLDVVEAAADSVTSDRLVGGATRVDTDVVSPARMAQLCGGRIVHGSADRARALPAFDRRPR
jgi:hypothetical protein